MAFGSTAKTSTPKSLGNIDKDNLNSNQEAVPVPYLAGRNRIPVTWITPAYNRNAVKQSSGSGSSKSAGTGGESYKYYVDLVTAICVCGRTPLQAISQIIVDHVIVWSGNLTRRAGYPYESITVPKYGEMRIYWGQTDQPVMDWFTPHFNATTADDNFDAQPARTDDLPPYRGVALLVMKQFFLGKDRTQMPTVEVVVDRAPLWFDDQPAPIVDARGSNVIALLYEWMVDDWFGVDLDFASLVKADWLAAYAAAEDAGHHVSPLITDQNAFRQVVAQLLEYFDGWLRRDGSQLSVGFWRHGDTDTSTLPSLNDTQMTEEPELKSSGYGDTINQVTVAWRDSSNHFNDASQVANSTGNLRIVGEWRPASVSRPWIVDRAHVAAYAVEYINLNSQPHYTGPAKAKREWVAQYGVGPGKLIKLDSGTLTEEIVCRVTEASQSADRDGMIELTLDSERGLYPSLYRPDPPPRVGDFVVVTAVIAHLRVVTLPSGLKTDSNVQLSLLAERPDPTLTGFRVYLSRDNVTYDPLLGDATFAVRGTVALVYPADTATLDPVGMTVLLDGVDADLVVAQSDAAQAANTLLVFIDDEIMSVGEVTALGNGQYRVALKRALYGTAQAAHYLNAEVWFHFQADLPILEAPGTIEKGLTVYLKLATHNTTADQSLSDAAMVEYTVGLESAVGAAFGLTLSTDAKVTTMGLVESHIQATWLNYADQGIDEHEVAIKRADADETAWDYRVLNTPLADWTVTPSTLYQVKIRPINDLGEPGAWSDVQSITSASISPFSITGLELVGMANGLINEEPDFHFAWRLNSPARAGSVGGTDGQPLAAGLQDPVFGYYLVQVLDATTRAVVKQDKTSTPAYVFTKSMNSLAFGGEPHPVIIFRVAAIDSAGGPSDWVEIEPSNPAPPKPTGLSAQASYTTIQTTWVFAVVPDLAGADLALGATPDISQAAVFYGLGLTTLKTLPFPAGGVAYLWVREYDTFGSQSDWTGPVQVFVGTVPASDIVGLAKKLSQQYPNTVEIEGIVWGNNTPADGSISWTCPTTGPCISWNGNQYVIASGSTALEFVWWKGGEAAFRSSDTNPETDPTVSWDPATCFQIARNYLHSGVAEQVWVFVANETVGSFYALDAAIKHGVFGQLIADEVDVFGTLQIQGDAVTVPASSVGADIVYADWTVVHEQVVAGNGVSPCFVFGGCSNSADQNSGITSTDFKVVRLEDGYVLFGSLGDMTVTGGTVPLPITGAYDPQTLDGPNTYQYWLRGGDHPGANWTQARAATARVPSLSTLLVKK